MIVMEIQLILFQQQTIITIELRKALVFVLIITFLGQQNDLYLHLGRRLQNRIIKLIIQRLILCFYLSEKHSLFSIFVNRKLLNSNDQKTDHAIN